MLLQKVGKRLVF
uniref:Uncharacterized protein n=1 Tax=Arundo donax TaxID=35708 RepID=A0A0A8ZIK4_ARUDO